MWYRAGRIAGLGEVHEINCGSKYKRIRQINLGAKYNGINPTFTLGVLFSILPAEEAGDIAGENELLFELW